MLKMKKNRFIITEWINLEVAVIWLNRTSSRNAYSKDMVEEFIDTLKTLNRNKKIKLCLIRSKGVDFCAGGDIKLMYKQRDLFQGPRKRLENTYKKYIQSLTLLFDSLNYLTISYVQGAAVGAGFGLALSADLCWANPNAYFKLPFFALGLVPADGSFWRLQRRIGFNSAFNILIHGNVVKAEEALMSSIVDCIKNEQDIEESCLNLNQSLKNFSKGDWSKIVRFLKSSKTKSLKNHLKDMRKIQSVLQTKEEYLTAVRKFLK